MKYALPIVPVLLAAAMATGAPHRPADSVSFVVDHAPPGPSSTVTDTYRPHRDTGEDDYVMPYLSEAARAEVWIPAVGRGMLIAPDLAVTFYHGSRVHPGKETGIAFMFPLRRLARERLPISGHIVTPVYPEDTVPARVICFSPEKRYDYIIWQVLGPLPEGVKPVPVSHDLYRATWFGLGLRGRPPSRVRFTGRFVRIYAADYPELELLGVGKLRLMPGFSGTPVFTDRGELLGLHVMSNGDRLSYITWSRWWTCHLRERR